MAAEITAALIRPTFTWANDSWELKEMFAMKSETVNPIPARAPAPAISLKVKDSGLRAMLSRTANQAKSVIPSIFPMTRPKINPAEIGEVIVWLKVEKSMRTPILVKANNGMTKKALYG